MENFQERLTRLLAEKFPGMNADFGPINSSDRYSGVLTWSGFSGKDFVDRQDAVWNFLRQALGSDAQFVSTLVTLTPEELASYGR